MLSEDRLAAQAGRPPLLRICITWPSSSARFSVTRELFFCRHLLAGLAQSRYHRRSMKDVTQLLNALDQGDPHAAEELLPLVYQELRKLAAQRMAQEQPGQTLEPTAPVHEVYIRLVGQEDPGWQNRGHCFAAAVAQLSVRFTASPDLARRGDAEADGAGPDHTGGSEWHARGKPLRTRHH